MVKFGRRAGLKIQWAGMFVPVQVRLAVQIFFIKIVARVKIVLMFVPQMKLMQHIAGKQPINTVERAGDRFTIEEAICGIMIKG
jgi:hypothetical protein